VDALQNFEQVVPRVRLLEHLSPDAEGRAGECLPDSPSRLCNGRRDPLDRLDVRTVAGGAGAAPLPGGVQLTVRHDVEKWRARGESIDFSGIFLTFGVKVTFPAELNDTTCVLYAEPHFRFFPQSLPTFFFYTHDPNPSRFGLPCSVFFFGPGSCAQLKKKQKH